MMGNGLPSAERSARITRLLASSTGAPDRPPASSAWRRPFTASRESVVLVAITPSSPLARPSVRQPWRRKVSAITPICDSSRSGAIFTNTGMRRWWRWASCSRRSITAPSSASSAASLCRLRRFCVLGLEMLTVT